MKPSHDFDVAVVGSGLIGLSCAYELAQRGFSVAVIESSTEIGGLGRSISLSNGKRCEAFYHHYFTQDLDLLSYINALLQDTIVYKRTTMSIFAAGEFHSWNGLTDLFSSRLIGATDKFRFLISTMLLAAKWLPDRFMANKSLTSGMRMLYGKRVYKKIWGPMIMGKFGSEAANTSLEWMSGRLSQRLSSRSRGAEYLGFLPGSLSRLTQGIANEIIGYEGSRFYLGTRATSINHSSLKSHRRYAISTASQDSSASAQLIYADKVLFTINSSKANRVLASLKSCECNWQHDSYFRAVCVLLEMKASISPFYWNNLADENCFFTGYIEQTQLTGIDEYGGITIGYLTKYLAPSDPNYSSTNSDFKRLALSDLSTIAPQFKSDDLISITVSIAEDAQVITPIGYKPNSPSLPGIPWIKLVNISMTYPDERGINNAIKLGIQAARLVEEC